MEQQQPPQLPGFVADRGEAAERVERLLGYRFRDRALLEEALTHSWHPRDREDGRATYQRLEFIGDAALGLAFASLFYGERPPLDQGELTALRSANTSEEKFARVAVRHGLYPLLRRYNCDELDRIVAHFMETVRSTVPCSGDLKAPKVLPDIVEAIAGAVYIDCNFDFQVLQKVAVAFCHPIITKQKLYEDPVSLLNLLGSGHRKELVRVLKIPNVTLDAVGNIMVSENDQVGTDLANGSADGIGELRILQYYK